METLHIENTWVQKRVIPNLNVQIIYMDGPYLPVGADQIILKSEESDNNNDDTELTYTPQPYIVSRNDGELIILGCLDPNASIYCFFDYSIRPIEYTESQEFTDLFNRAQEVLSYALGPHGVSKTIKLK